MSKPVTAPSQLSDLSGRKLAANRTNAQLSTGPTSAAGKLASSRNNLRHGLTGTFCVLPEEDAAEFNRMQTALLDEHQPTTETESALILDMARHYWIYQRALRLQDECFFDDLNTPAVQNRLSLYLRYGTTHERGYRRCLHDLLKLRKDRLRMQRGFESQERERAAELRREAAEKRHESEELRRERAEERRQATWDQKKLRDPNSIEYVTRHIDRIFNAEQAA